MTNYIKNYIEQMIEAGAFSDGHFEILARELDRLDPRDFEPAVQAEFIWLRARMYYVLQIRTANKQPTEEFLKSILPLLDKYRGEHSRGIQRSFAFLSDAELKSIVERDYTELSLVLFPGGAWKSCVVMAGSILEAILTDVLTESSRISATLASAKRPPKGDITKGEWKLEKLIEVAVDMGILPRARADSIDQVLRDYRNFVHPKKELRSQHECTEAEGLMAKGNLDGVCNHLEKTL